MEAQTQPLSDSQDKAARTDQIGRCHAVVRREVDEHDAFEQVVDEQPDERQQGDNQDAATVPRPQDGADPMVSSNVQIRMMIRSSDICTG